MIKLTKTEKDQVVKLSKKFVTIHQEMLQVENVIQKMKERAEILIADLENCRKEENNFVVKLHNKYGNGNLDPINLNWVKEDVIFQIENKL
jgi:hypothetical protein